MWSRHPAFANIVGFSIFLHANVMDIAVTIIE
jgi:hypothetical protein